MFAKRTTSMPDMFYRICQSTLLAMTRFQSNTGKGRPKDARLFGALMLGLMFLFMPGTASGQSILKEMAFSDISMEQDVRTTVVRDLFRAALVIRTNIADLSVRSNNVIFSTDTSTAGRLVILLTPGTHRLVFEADGFVSATRRVFFEAREVQGLAIERQQRRSSLLKVNSTPTEAQVLLEGVEQGATPLVIENLEPGDYTLLIRKEGFRSYLSPVELRAGEEHNVFAALEREVAYPLQINAFPQAALVEINQVAYGATPFEQQFPVDDTLHIILHMPGFQEIERKIVMGQPQQLVIDFEQEGIAIVDGKNRKWLFWAGGAVTVAGAAAALLLRGGDDSPADNPGIGQPRFPGEQ